MLPNHVTWNLELFLLGFTQHSTIFQPKEEANIKLNYWTKNNLFSAFNELSTVAKEKPHAIPNAILLNSKLLKDETNLLFLKSFKQHPVLKDIPIIAVSESNDEHPGCEELIKLGIDDHYICPLDGDMLEKRIDFLSEFKDKYSDFLNTEQEEVLEYKIPLPKRIFDIAVASAIILAISPILAAIAIAIRLESKGGIVYKSNRIGTGYRGFHFLKFRSMYADADKRLAELQHLNRYNENGGGSKSDGPTFMKFKNDPRITRVGKFIRKTSLDELPQLFNVLRGEMSIVGNRPLPLYEAEQLTKDQWAKRFLAPAGMTGLWQVSPNGKDTMSVEQRIGLDIDYANDFSFARDMQILAKTPFAMIQKSE